MSCQRSSLLNEDISESEGWFRSSLSADVSTLCWTIASSLFGAMRVVGDPSGSSFGTRVGFAAFSVRKRSTCPTSLYRAMQGEANMMLFEPRLSPQSSFSRCLGALRTTPNELFISGYSVAPPYAFVKSHITMLSILYFELSFI